MGTRPKLSQTPWKLPMTYMNWSILLLKDRNTCLAKGVHEGLLRESNLSSKGLEKGLIYNEWEAIW